MPTLFIGDVHCNKLKHKIPNFRDLVLQTLSDTLDIGLERGCDRAIICGDIFDSPSPTQDDVVDLLSTLSKKECEVHLLLGNHDSADTSTHSLKIAKWASKWKGSNLRVILKPTVLTLPEGQIWCLPHPYVEDLPKKFLFGVGHFAVNGAKSDSGFIVRSKHCPKGRWVLGDFHSPQGGRANSCKYQYVGSLTQLSFAEHAKKRVLLYDDGDFESIAVPLAYKLKRATITSLDDLPKIENDNTFWQLKYVSHLTLPSDWVQSHPNIVEILPTAKNTKDKRAEVLLEGSEYVVNPLKFLEPYLRKHAKLSDAQLQRALKIADTLRL